MCGVVQAKDGSVSVVTPGVSPSIFKILGTQPLMGRTFTEEEGQAGGPKVVLLSEGLWRASFNSDPEILSRTIRVNGQPRAVVGVMPQSFRFPESMGEGVTKGVWLAMQPTAEMSKDRGYSLFSILATHETGSHTRTRAIGTDRHRKTHSRGGFARRKRSRVSHRRLSGDANGPRRPRVFGAHSSAGPRALNRLRKRGEFADRAMPRAPA